MEVASRCCVEEQEVLVAEEVGEDEPEEVRASGQDPVSIKLTGPEVATRRSLAEGVREVQKISSVCIFRQGGGSDSEEDSFDAEAEAGLFHDIAAFCSDKRVEQAVLGRAKSLVSAELGRNFVLDVWPGCGQARRSTQEEENHSGLTVMLNLPLMFLCLHRVRATFLPTMLRLICRNPWQ